MPKSFIGLSVAVLVICILVSACGARDLSSNEYPLPGQMRILSVEAAGRIYTTENFLRNGDFSVWQAGAPAPEGFRAPSDRKISFLMQQDARGGVGKYSVDQYWHSSDAGLSFNDMFSTIVDGVKKGKYTLCVNAIVYDDSSASMSCMAVDSAGNALEEWRDIIKVEPGSGKPQKYCFEVDVKQDCSIIIAAHTNAQSQYRNRVVWLQWEFLGRLRKKLK